MSLLGGISFILYTCLVASIPNHGQQKFLGFSYWMRRYPSLGYTSDWDGFWNNYASGRVRYERGRSETSGLACVGCLCDEVTEELKCRGSPTAL